MTTSTNLPPVIYREPTTRRLPSTVSKAEIHAKHRKKMREKAARAYDTPIMQEVAGHNRAGTLRHALGNHWRSRPGRKRTRAPTLSIWPEGKTAKPGRMA